MIMSLLRKRYSIPIVSYLIFSFLWGGILHASPSGDPGPHGDGWPPGSSSIVSKPPERRGDRLYWTPACPIVAQNFNNAADVNGATSDPSSTGWYLDASKVPNAVYFAMKSHRIKAQTLGGVGVWYSQPFNIAGWTNVQIDAKISSEGTFTNSEYMTVGYILDGKETDFETVHGSFGNDSTPTVTSGYLAGSTVQIVVKIYNVTAGNSYYYVEQYDVFKKVGPCTVSSGISVSASASNSGVLTCTNPSTTLSASTTASGATTYSWTGPSGFTATGASVTTSTAGTYNVTATNSAGTGTASVTVTGNTTAPAGVAITPNLAALTCANPSATLTGGSSTAGVSYAWSGPNSFTATGKTTTVISAGEYILTVTDPTNGCTSTTAATISANFTAPANVTAVNNGPQTCYNVYPTLTGSSTTTGTTYAWTGPNGFTATGATANVTSFGQGGGTYTLTATNPTNGCTAIATTVVAVDINAPTGVNVVSSTGSPVLNCTNPSLRLTASSSTPGVTYAWRIGPTGSTVLGTGDTLTVTQPNQYDVLVQNPENGCAFLGGITVSQNVTPPSNLFLTSNPTAAVLTCTTTSIACNANASGSKVGYTWTGPGGFTFYGQTTNLSAPGTYSVTATDSTDGCSSTASTTITQDITPPSAVTIGSATGTTIINCTNPTLSLTAGSSPNTASYSWSGPNNYSSNNATASVTVPGTYIVTATLASNGCSKTANVLIALDTASPAGITTSSVPANATLTCTNPNVVLTGNSVTPGVAYNWTGPNNFSAPGSSVTVATPGNYVVTVTNPVNGCSSAVTASAVTQNLSIPIGVSTITSNKLSCNITSVSVTANSSTSGATYTWTGPQGFTADTRVISATLGGAYTVTVTNPANGCTTSKTATVVADTATPAGVTATNSGPLTCTATAVTLTGNSTTAGVTYTWNGPNGFFDPEQVSTSATDSGSYILTASNPGNGCITNDTTYVSADFSECSSVTPKVTAAKAGTFNDSTTTGAFTYKVFPNPTGNAAVSITFNSPMAANVVVAIYNNAGVQERVLFSNAVEANQPYRLTLNPGGLGSGIHYCQIRVNDKVYTTKLLVLPN
jgi:hypothetical protein